MSILNISTFFAIFCIFVVNSDDSNYKRFIDELGKYPQDFKDDIVRSWVRVTTKSNLVQW